jgi:hypothetical protein
MQFVLVSNNQLLLGPMPWNFRMFESSLKEDLGIALQLPVQKTDDTSIEIAQDVRILSVSMLPNPEYNPRTQGLHGPFFDYVTDPTKAIGHYEVMNLPVDAVKNFMLAEVAANRYKQEIAGVQVVIQGTTLNVTTNRGDRDIYAQGLLLGSTGAQWKFPGGVWMTLTNAELQTIVQAIMTHVQTAFNWETTKGTEINSKTTLVDLAAVNLTYGN